MTIDKDPPNPSWYLQAIINNHKASNFAYFERSTHALLIQSSKMSEPFEEEKNTVHLRHCMLYEWQCGHDIDAAVSNICRALGEDTVSVWTCRRWFSRFRSGNLSLDDLPRSGRQRKCNSSALIALLEEDSRITTRDLAQRLGLSHTTVGERLAEMGKVSKLGTWVPHELSRNNKDDRITACSALLLTHIREPFLERIVTGDEKWVLYINPLRKRQWCDKTQVPTPHPKQGRHPRKVMLSVWWDIRGIIYFELLPRNATVTAEVYCGQLDRLRDAIAEKRPGMQDILFLHDNAPPHTALVTRQKLTGFEWELLPHPPYSPDLAPTDYHLFRSLQNHLNGKKFEDDGEITRELHSFFDSKPPEFYQRGISALVERWRYVLNNDGNYFTD